MENNNYCTQCGARIEEDSNFCTVCGRKIEKVFQMPEVEKGSWGIISAVFFGAFFVLFLICTVI